MKCPQNLRRKKISAKLKARAIYELRQRFSVSNLLHIAQIPHSSYYYYVKQLQRPDKYEDARAKIQEIFVANKGRYGYRRITTALHNQNIVINHKTVQRLMRELGLFCRVRMKKYSSYRGEVGEAAPNILNRDFKAEPKVGHRHNRIPIVRRKAVFVSDYRPL